MNAKTSRWIATGILALLAVGSILNSSNEETLISTAILAVIFGLFIMIGKRNSLVTATPMILFGWLHFGSQIMGYGTNLRLDSLLGAVESMVEYLANEMDEITLLSGAAAIVLHLCTRGVDKKPVILLRYLILGWFLYNFAPTSAMFQLFALVALVNMSFELSTCGSYFNPYRRFANTFLVCGFFFLLCFAYSYRLPWEYMQVLMDRGAFSVYTIIAVGVLGGLTILEQASDKENQVYYLKSFKNLGSVLLFWCGAALVMLLFKELNNADVLVLAPIVLYQLYAFFAAKWRENNTASSEKTVFYVAWSLITVLVLALAKSVQNENMFTVIFLILAPIIAVIIWYIVRNGGHEKEIMVKFMGIAATIALSLTVKVRTSNTVELATFILSVALLCVFWCLVCGKIYRLDSTASTVDRQEFKTLASLQKYAPLVVIAVALVKILFSDTGI